MDRRAGVGLHKGPAGIGEGLTGTCVNEIGFSTLRPNLGEADARSSNTYKVRYYERRT